MSGMSDGGVGLRATWVLPDGRQISATVTPGTSLMQAAVAQGVPRVIGECGGSMSCATCHVVVAPDWAAVAGPASGFEEAMLDMATAARQPASRLSCQMVMTAALDGIVLHVPGA